MTPGVAQAQSGAETPVLRVLATPVQLLALRPGRLTQNMLCSCRNNVASHLRVYRYADAVQNQPGDGLAAPPLPLAVCHTVTTDIFISYPGFGPSRTNIRMPKNHL